MMSCLQQFCYTCILWWSERTLKCPHCKRRATSILHLARVDGSFEKHVFRSSVELSVIFHQAGGASGCPTTHRCHRPAASQPSAAGLVPGVPVGSFHPYIWASLLHVYPAVVQTLLPWLCRKLKQLSGAERSEDVMVEYTITSTLHPFGLDKNLLGQLLRVSL